MSNLEEIRVGLLKVSFVNKNTGYNSKACSDAMD